MKTTEEKIKEISSKLNEAITEFGVLFESLKNIQKKESDCSEDDDDEIDIEEYMPITDANDVLEVIDDLENRTDGYTFHDFVVEEKKRSHGIITRLKEIKNKDILEKLSEALDENFVEIVDLTGDLKKEYEIAEKNFEDAKKELSESQQALWVAIEFEKSFNRIYEALTEMGIYDDNDEDDTEFDDIESEANTTPNKFSNTDRFKELLDGIVNEIQSYTERAKQKRDESDF